VHLRGESRFACRMGGAPADPDCATIPARWTQAQGRRSHGAPSFPRSRPVLLCEPIPPKDVPQKVALKQAPPESYQKNVDDNAKKMLEDGMNVFRFDTFASESFGATSSGCTRPSLARSSGESVPG
jgi:hypothetical protein